MSNHIWHSPLYTFLKFANSKRDDTENPSGNKVLDCGAGGKFPPLALFDQYGYETYGIDISVERIELAKEQDRNVNIGEGDMRSIPFDDSFFDFVYEMYSICHLTKKDIAIAISEMARVLKKGGYLYIGFISSNTFPMTGTEGEPGEFWLPEDNDDEGGDLHSVFDDDEIESYISNFDIIQIDKIKSAERETYEKISREEWNGRFESGEIRDLYDERTTRANFTHTYYILRKPLEE